jgi:hypothetical protein
VHSHEFYRRGACTGRARRPSRARVGEWLLAALVAFGVGCQDPTAQTSKAAPQPATPTAEPPEVAPPADELPTPTASAPPATPVVEPPGAARDGGAPGAGTPRLAAEPHAQVDNPASAQPAAPPMEEPTNAKPVVAAATIEPADAAPGADVELVVRIRTAPAWHIYAAGKSGAAGMPTRLELSLPDGLELLGDWKNPEPDVRPSELGPEYILQGDVEFRHALRVTDAAAAGPLEATCVVTYQACDHSRCLLPAKIAAAAACTITPPTE